MSVQPATTLPILVVDDEKNYRIILSRILTGAGYKVLTADCPQAAMRVLREQPVALVLSDLRMPEIDGIELCRRVSQEIGPMPFILFSAFLSQQCCREIDGIIGAWGSLSKPFDNQEVLALIEEVLATSISEEDLSDGQGGDAMTLENLYTRTEEQEKV